MNTSQFKVIDYNFSIGSENKIPNRVKLNSK